MQLLGLCKSSIKIPKSMNACSSGFLLMLMKDSRFCQCCVRVSSVDERAYISAIASLSY